MDRRRGPSTARTDNGSRRLVLNPTSGGGNHVERARRLAREHGFDVVETEQPGHATELARQAAADGVDLLAACGGDGTLHEVVQGLVAADAADDVTVSVVPAGTENIVAGDLGIPDLAAGFEVADRGVTRYLDMGVVDDEPFVMSALAGLPAQVSADASHELKNRFGSFAFVVGAMRQALTFDGVRIEVDAVSGDEAFAWAGDALCVLVGNLRSVSGGRGQADAEDGLLEVTIMEELPPADAVAEAIERRLLDRETEHVTHLEAPRVDIVGLEQGSVTFSLDGEIRTHEQARLEVSPGALKVRVGDAYDPNPADG